MWSRSHSRQLRITSRSTQQFCARLTHFSPNISQGHCRGKGGEGERERERSLCSQVVHYTRANVTHWRTLPPFPCTPLREEHRQQSGESHGIFCQVILRTNSAELPQDKVSTDTEDHSLHTSTLCCDAASSRSGRSKEARM